MFIKGASGENSCPLGYDYITTPKTCQLGAQELEKSNVAAFVNMSSRHKGCYSSRYTPWTFILNVHATGAATTWGKTVCKFGMHMFCVY